MRAIIMHAPHEMRVGEWETPRPMPREAVIAVKAAGICSGDMAMYEGKFSTKLGGGIYPRVAGHEIAGVVSQVGGASRWLWQVLSMPRRQI